jgi:predicted ArsR family transcriptional regulator
VRRDLEDTITRLCVLDDPARRAAYVAVRTAGKPLTRAEVADEVGISISLASFHLEKLLAEGFVEATYVRDEAWAVAGRPAKRYRPTNLELEVSIPPRRYDLAAEILAEALDEDSAEPPQEALDAIAAEYGRQVGGQVAPRSGDSRLLAALRLVGYEPTVVGDEVLLRNCPFRQVAVARPEVICRMNLAFVAGVVVGAQAMAQRAVLAPTPGRCCVVLAS